MSTAPFLSRHLGHYLLVAPLGEDALGSVFRALHAADERRFVRLRILRSEELDSESIEAAVRQNASRQGALVHSAIVDRPHLETVQGIPFMTWDETSGWTLDAMFARVRALGIRIPAEYALLIAERIAAALEHVHRTRIDGLPASHGLLWPGFVSISHDAVVRVGGFGLAEAVLPTLARPRMTAEIAPYVASETRAGGATGARSDVYSLGAILAELLTGRKPSLDDPVVELRAGDPRSEELGAFLHRCMAPVRERFASAVDAHREIQRMVTGNPFSLYTANLALFLYKLLNPESQLAAPSGDWESTNPVVVNATATQPAAVSEPPAGDCASEPLPEVAVPAAEVTAVAKVLRAAEVAEVAEEEPAVEIVVEAIAQADGLVIAMPSQAAESTAVTRIEEPDAPNPDVPFEAVSNETLRAFPVRAWGTAWTRPASALAAAAGLTVAAFLIVGQFHEEGRVSAPRPRAGVRAALGRVAVQAHSAPSVPSAPDGPLAAAVPIAVVSSSPAGHFETAAVRPDRPVRASKPAPPPSRQPADDLRLRAALARIEADRWNAKDAAGDIFGEGRHSEEEGERLLRTRDYEAAELAFSRAARLFQKAQEISWEERLRQANLGSGQ